MRSILSIAALVLALTYCVCVQDTQPVSAQPPAGAAQPANAQPPAAPPTPMTIVVEDVRGEVQFQRKQEWQDLTKEIKLTQGDRVMVNIGAILKLEFQQAVSGAVLSAAILRGHTEVSVAEAYTRGEQSRTQLDVNQGVIRVGVVRTAVPPSYQVRTPRQVVGVRGTEIAEIETTPMGDLLRMGRIGIVTMHDNVPLSRSARAGQGSEKRADGNRRDDTLLRAIEFALLDSRVFLHGPHRPQLEVDFDRQSFDLVEFGGDLWKEEGSARYEIWRNSHGNFSRASCPQCPRGSQSGGSHGGGTQGGGGVNFDKP